MAKKKNGRRNARLDDSDDDSDSISTLSTASYADEEYSNETVMEDYIDALYEKRSSTREASLKGLVGAFTSNVMLEYAESNSETLSQLFLACLKKGSAGEASLAARALGLLCVTLGADEKGEHILEAAEPVLTKLSKSASSTAVRISAIEALSIIAFVNSPDTESTQAIMDVFWSICSLAGRATQKQKSKTSENAGKSSPELKAAAMSAWTLLLSTIPASQLQQFCRQRDSFSELSNFLKDDNPQVRAAAGEAIALLHESSGTFFNYVDSDSDDSGETASRNSESTSDNAVEAMRSLSVMSRKGSGQSRRDRLAHKANFRGILSSIEDGGIVSSSVKLKHGDVLQISTWSHKVQLDALRKFLAEGFQLHVQNNELLHEVFDYTPKLSKPAGFASLAEKRLMQSPNSVFSKARTQERLSSRALTQSEKYGRFASNEEEGY